MGLKILCSGYLFRLPFGGLNWHHIQYLVGFQRMGHTVHFFEDYGWPNSCYDMDREIMSPDPANGIARVRELLGKYDLDQNWCYLAEDGSAHGMTRDRLAQLCRDCDVYFNLSNINWIPELKECRRRVLVDTDPVFTQIKAHGLGKFSDHHVLFTYGENVHKSGCEMPTGGVRWLPTRQPVVLDLWPTSAGDPSAALTSVMNWSAYGECTHEERVYGQKDREFEPFFSLPRETGERMELAIRGAETVASRLTEGGWQMVEPKVVADTPWTYQKYLKDSRAEFSVAKHGYVSTRCGWFSDRSAAYLAMGRPVVVQDDGFSDFIPCGKGILSFQNKDEAMKAISSLKNDYESHCLTARKIAEEYFDSEKVLSKLLTLSL
jgi:hypothetical protein